MANRQQKWIQWNWFLMKKVPLCNARRLSDPGDEPVTCDDEGAKVCQNPLRGSKVEAGKQGNKYFPVEKKA